MRDAIVVPLCIHLYLSHAITFLIVIFGYSCSSATCKAKALKVWWLLVNPLAQWFPTVASRLAVSVSIRNWLKRQNDRLPCTTESETSWVERRYLPSSCC